MPTRNINTVLLVENEPLIALDLEAMLLSVGVQGVHHVLSSGDALDWLRDHRPDLAVLDIFVTDGSSMPVADWLRGHGVPFVIHSGHTKQSPGNGAGLSDAIWLSKPCTDAELAAAIDLALDER